MNLFLLTSFGIGESIAKRYILNEVLDFTDIQPDNHIDLTGNSLSLTGTVDTYTSYIRDGEGTAGDVIHTELTVLS